MNTILTEKEEDFAEKRNRRKTRTGRALGWILLAAAVLFIIPVGGIMFVISGVWSAADRVMNRIGK